ncbi:MAG: hypothetical protein CM15mL2_0160 [Caudoviricetes sp.]|nr:MAG: hypothetical protein CM15mL2_0160 [Caudoviricetes sp.]
MVVVVIFLVLILDKRTTSNSIGDLVFGNLTSGMQTLSQRKDPSFNGAVQSACRRQGETKRNLLPGKIYMGGFGVLLIMDFFARSTGKKLERFF